MPENNWGPRIWSMRGPAWAPASKLTGQQRDEIKRRRSDGESAKSLALEYGVSVRTIYQNS